MTVNIAFTTTVARLRSEDSNYATALNGPADSVLFNDFDTGQALFTSQFAIFETFAKWSTPVNSGELVTSAHILLEDNNNNDPSAQRDLEYRVYDFGASITTSDWRTPSQLAALPLIGTVVGVNSSDNTNRAGSDLLLSTITSAEEVEVVASDSRTRLQIAPDSQENNSNQDPDNKFTIVYTTVPTSTLLLVGGACVQLSDGTHALLESDAAAFPQILLRHHDGSTISTVATVDDGSGTNFSVSADSFQGLALVADASDNLYVIGRSGSGNTLAARAYTKSVGHVWSAQNRLTTSMPGYSTGINNIAAAWNAVGAGGGTIRVQCMHSAGTGGDNFSTYAYLNCASLLAGSGTLARAVFSDVGNVLTLPSNSDYVTYQNPSGTGLDVASASDVSDIGFIITYNRNDLESITRYDFDADGDFSNYLRATSSVTVTRNADSKARVIAVDSTTLIWSVSGRVVVWSMNASSASNLGSSDLTTQGITSFPSESTLRNSAAWDVVYDAAANKAWFYYLDQADSHRLMRTGFDLNTMLATKEEIEVNATVGATGSTNLAIRAPRGDVDATRVLLAIANENSGVHSTIYVLDSQDPPPLAPTLIERSNFDATLAAQFAWVFNDPGDTQSAFQLQINTTAGATAYDSGKVTSATSNHLLPASTLANGNDYQWRVRTWDAADQVGPYSSFDTFSTSASGNVTITDPPADVLAGLFANYNITWTVTGATQEEYRVRVVNTVSGAEHSNTGFVTSAATSFTVTGLLSDVTYRVEVTVKDNGVESSIGTRLITPAYATPETPVVLLTPVPDEFHIRVDITNPPPTGDTPEVTENRIFRRPSGGTGTFELVGTVGPNEFFLDFTAPSGVELEYFVRGDNASKTADSVVLATTLVFQGVVLHDPEDPEATVRQFLYGKAARSAGVDVPAAELVFAGRTYPVFEFGEHQSDTYAVTVLIPFGATWAGDLAALRDFAQVRGELVFRDNRGRTVDGVLNGFGEDDAGWGTQVSFTFEASSVVVETTVGPS